MTVFLKPILNISTLSPKGVALKGTSIVGKMTGNVNFPTPNPTLADVTDAVDKLNSKIEQQDLAWLTYHEKTVEVQEYRDLLANVLEAVRSYVGTIARGSESVIASAGLDVRQKPVPTGVLPAPHGVEANTGSSDGEIIVTWERVKGAKAYVVEMCYDLSDAANWTHYASLTPNKCYITGLESGTRIYVRVTAINKFGQGGYSDPATKTVP